MTDHYGRPSLTLAGIEIVWIGWRSGYPLLACGRWSWRWRVIAGPLDVRYAVTAAPAAGGTRNDR